MIDFDSDVSIMQATVIEDGRARITLHDGTILDTDPAGLETLGGKMSWTNFVRDQYKYIIENPKPPKGGSIKDPPARDPAAAILARADDDPLVYAKAQKEKYNGLLQGALNLIEQTMSKADGYRNNLNKWTKIVEELESDE